MNADIQSKSGQSAVSVDTASDQQEELKITPPAEINQELLANRRPDSLRTEIEIAGETFTFVGLGAQAAVYGSNGKILKVGHQVHQAFEVLENLSPDSANNLAQAIESNHAWNDLIVELREHLASGRVNSKLIANTDIEEFGLVWQDKVTPVEVCYDPNRLNEYSTKEIKKLIDAFADSFVASWKSGMAELECSLFTNYGFYANGELTMHDFGNSTFSYLQAVESVQGQVTEGEIEQFLVGKNVPQNESWPDWFLKGQVREALRDNPELFRYYVEKMASTVNVENLDRNWPKEYRDGVQM